MLRNDRKVKALFWTWGDGSVGKNICTIIKTQVQILGSHIKTMTECTCNPSTGGAEMGELLGSAGEPASLKKKMLYFKELSGKLIK